MYTLPYFLLPADVLIPHPSNTYTIVLEKDTLPSNFNLETSTIEFKNTQLTDVFLLQPVCDSKTTSFASLSKLKSIEETQESYSLTIEVIQKVKITKKDFSKATFTYISKKPLITKKHKKIFKDIITFIYLNDFLNSLFIDVDLQANDPFFLEKIISCLIPDINTDFDFYISKTINLKLNIISALLIESTVSLSALSNETDFHFFKKEKKYPPHVSDQLQKQKKRLSNMQPSSSDYGSTLDYIELLESLPWDSYSKNSVNINSIKAALDENHFGLISVKQNIIEYFALEQLTNQKTGAIFLFDGPPGTGKTSIAKAIATATNREFVSISLAGVSDEAEIRGHRRTYVGSKPGRIVSALSELTTLNPVILLDEIDKVSISNKGDPLSALLELFDVNQNSSFVDKYLEVPIDLSKAIFICTSNNKSLLPLPLQDRLEIITFYTYSFDEKVNIIQKHIFPFLLKKYALNEYKISLSLELIHLLSKEFDLREIKNIISRLLRYYCYKYLFHQEISVLTVDIYNSIYSLPKHHKIKRKIGFC